MRHRVHGGAPSSTYGQQPYLQYPHIDDGQYQMHDELLFDADGQPIYGPDGKQLIRKRQLGGAPLEEGRYGADGEYLGSGYGRESGYEYGSRYEAGSGRGSWGPRFGPDGEYIGDGPMTEYGEEAGSMYENLGRRTAVDEVVEIPHVQV